MSVLPNRTTRKFDVIRSPLTLLAQPKQRNSATQAHLERLLGIISRNADPDQPFFYLGGPMTGIPKFNFPRFYEVSKKLRDQGYNLVSPAELDDKGDAKAAMKSPDGAPGSGSSNGKQWQDFLARDVVICALPTCVGGIFIEGWEQSSGAKLESYVLDRLKKPIYLYEDSVNGPVLVQCQRDAELGWP